MYHKRSKQLVAIVGIKVKLQRRKITLPSAKPKKLIVTYFLNTNQS